MYLLSANTNLSLQANDFQEKVILALIALLGTIIVAFLGFIVGRRQIKNQEKRIPLEFLTEKRTEWISNIRNITADYWALIYKNCSAKAAIIPTDKVNLNDVKDMNELAGKLKLYLNPNSIIDKKVIAIIFEISEILNSSKRNFRAAQVRANRLMDYIGIILKVEWERVNLEVKEINISDKEKKKKLIKISISLLNLYKEESIFKREKSEELIAVKSEIEDMISSLKAELEQL